MRISFRQRQLLYEELARLARTDITLPHAFQIFLRDPQARSLQHFLHSALAAINSGSTPAEAMRQAGVGEMEAAILLAAERSGSSAAAFERLAAWFALLDRVRSAVLRQLAYPIFIFHFAVVLMAIPALISGTNRDQVLRESAVFLASSYLVIGLIACIAIWLVRTAQHNPRIDAVLQAIPVLGGARRGFILARFCSTWQMLLDAAIPPSDALTLAAAASASGRVRHAAAQARSDISAGLSPVDSLMKRAALPRSLLKVLRTGEESGTLDDTLKRWAAYYEEKAERRVETLSTWIPKLLTLVIFAYVGWRIISLYQGALRTTQQLLDM